MIYNDNQKTDKDGYDKRYRDIGNLYGSFSSNNPDEFVKRYKLQNLTPFSFGGGHIDGNVRGKVVESLFNHVKHKKKCLEDITILDAGCGLGGLSVYLACHGFSVIGVEISAVACEKAEKLAAKYGVSDRCIFLNVNLEKIPIPDSSVDLIIGLHTLHHFIKYDKVPNEFDRILKVEGMGFFADGFGENPIYRIFHDKKKMERLGDVVLYKKLIIEFLKQFKVKIIRVDLLSMLNKLILRVFGWKARNLFSPISKVMYYADKVIPNNRVTLFLSGTIMTIIRSNKF